LLAGLEALERWKENDKSWDYSGSESDYSVAQLLLDRVEGQVVAWHTASAERQAAAALRILHRQALLLHLTRSVEPKAPPLTDLHSKLSKALWVPDSSDTSPSAQVAAAVGRAEASRADVQRVLAEAIGCFQGIGSKLLALDPRRVKTAWRLNLADPSALQAKSDQGLARNAADDMFARIEGLLTRYRNVVEPTVPVIKALVGESGDINIGPPLLAQIEQSRTSGTFPQAVCTSAEAKRAIEQIGTSEAKSLIRQAISFEGPDATATVEARLAAWASLDVELLVKVHGALTLLDKVVRGIEREIDARLLASGGGDIGSMVAALQADLMQATQEGIT